MLLAVLVCAIGLGGCQSAGKSAQDVVSSARMRIELSDNVEPQMVRFVDNEHYLVAGSLKEVKSGEQNRDWLMLGWVSDASLYTVYVNDALDYDRLSVAPLEDGCLVQDVWTSDRAEDLLKINFADNSAEEYSLPYALQLREYTEQPQYYYLDEGEFLVCQRETDADDDGQVSTHVRIWNSEPENSAEAENAEDSADSADSAESNANYGDVIVTLDGNIRDVAWAQTGKSLLILSDTGDLVLLDVEQETAAAWSLPETTPVDGWLEYSQVFSLADSSMAVVSVQCEDGEVVQLLKLGQDNPEAYEFKIFADDGKNFSFLGAKGNYVYLLTANDAGYGEVFYWDYTTDMEGVVFSTEDDGYYILGGALSPDGKTLAVAARGDSDNQSCVFLLRAK
jgi:WD40 repeat protein